MELEVFIWSDEGLGGIEDELFFFFFVERERNWGEGI